MGTTGRIPRAKWPLLWAVIAVLAGCAGDTIVNPDGPDLAENTIHVSGSATVQATPDMAQTQAGVQTYARTVAEAVTANNTVAAAIIASARALGVEEADLQTVNFSVSPQRDYKNDRPDSITGYWVYNTVTVTIRQIDVAGQVLQAAVDAGANTVSGLSFTLADPAPVKEQARVAAMEDARSRAEVLADAAGVRVGKVLQIRETAFSYSPYWRSGMEDAADGGAVPVEPGDLEVSAQVEVVYAIK